MDKIYYVMEEDIIVFSGSATDCKRIANKLPNSRIEPPLISKKKHKPIQYDLWNEIEDIT